MLEPDPYLAACPSRQIIAAIGDKWSLLVIPLLKEGPKRNSELMRRIEGVSQKMLTQTVRRLEDRNLVLRVDYGEVPPKVDYSLTELGLSLAVLIDALDQWVIDHFHELNPPK